MFLKLLSMGTLTFVTSHALAAASYPSRPVRMIVPSGAGGVTDVLGRVVAPKLGERLGQQVVIDNRPGASGIVGSQIVAGAAPDGHTLLMVFPSHVVNPALFPAIPYDTVKAFAPITMVSTVSLLLIVNGDFPAKSTQDLIALPGFEARGWNGILAPAGTPGNIIDRLHKEIAGIVRSAEFAQNLANEGATAVGNSPAEFAAVIRADIRKWAAVVRAAEIRGEPLQ